MGGQGWLLPVAALLLGGGGIGTILGFIVQRQSTKSTASAVAVAHAIDGLTRLAQEQREELDDLRSENARLRVELQKARRSR